MNGQNLIDSAEKNLERQLEWIARYDARVSFIAGVSIAMIAYLASVAGEVVVWNNVIALDFFVSGLFLFASLLCIYFGQYPKTNSCNSSLIYFNTIADMTCENFKKQFKNLSETDYLDDLLAQTHNNSLIISKKFTFLKTALILLLISVLPWALTIFMVKTAN
ncbi:MAG: Pycsar system effector family protein [Patescibacteria group bacterium]